MKKIFNEMKRMQELAGVISESSNTLREVASQGEIDTGIDNIKNKIKKLSRPVDARNETFQANEAMTAEVQKDITTFIEAFVKNEKSNEYPMFAAQKNDPNALAEAKRNFIFNEIDNRISNFFFNSGSGSFVRMYSDPYKIQVVMEMKKVADALKIPRLSKGLQSAIDAYKRGYKPEESAIDKIRAQAGIQPKAVTSESKKISIKELKKLVMEVMNENPLGGQQTSNVAPKLNPADETKALNNAFLTANKIANDPNVLKQIKALPEDKVKMLQNLFIKYKIDPKADIDKVALTKAEDKIDDKIISEMMSEMEDDAVMPPKQKLANVLNALGSGNIAAWGGLPLAIGIGATVGSVALGLAASWGATAVLMGIAKALDKTGKL